MKEVIVCYMGEIKEIYVKAELQYISLPSKKILPSIVLMGEASPALELETVQLPIQRIVTPSRAVKHIAGYTFADYEKAFDYVVTNLVETKSDESKLNCICDRCGYKWVEDTLDVKEV